MNNFFFYSILAFPLAFIGLPIYVYIANFYVNEFALSVSLIGMLIFVARFFDVFEDIFIGHLSDKLLRKGFTRKKIILATAPFLAASFYFLFNPFLNLTQTQIAIWFLISLISVYTFFSIIAINYNAMAAEITNDYNSRTKITASREFVALIGILSASILPVIIAMFFGKTQEQALSISSLWFGVILLVFVVIFYAKLKEKSAPKSQEVQIFTKNLQNILANKKFKSLLVIFFINSIAVSLPAGTFLFFVEDVLLAKSKTGIFLGLYFLSAALAMPFWNFAASRFGKKNAWVFSILLSVCAFFWAFFLNSQNYEQFYAICFISGLMLGADLAIPPSILADIVNKSRNISSYFAIWNMASKLALACASGFALIFLGQNGFRQSTNEMQANESLFYLSLIYALIPCLLKLLTAVILIFTNIEKKELTI